MLLSFLGQTKELQERNRLTCLAVGAEPGYGQLVGVSSTGKRSC